MNTGKKALTLIEVLLTAFLFLGVGIIIYLFLQKSIDASALGALHVQMESNARLAMEQISTEARQAVLLPCKYPSPVLWPHLALSSNNGSTVPAQDKNRFIFAEVVYDLNAGGNLFDLNNYRLVELRVERDAAGVPSLRRKVYAADYMGSPIGVRGIHDDQALATVLSDFVNPEENEALLSLTGSNDAIEMDISHNYLSFDNRYDPRLFKITLTLTQCLNNDSGKVRSVTLSSQLRMKTQ